jgi:probable HAF family extracellular repeat protein
LSLQTDGARQSFSNLFFIQSFKYLCVVFTALALASAALAGQATSPTAAGATASAHGQVTPSRTGTGAGGIRGHGFVHDAGGNFTTIDVPGATSLTIVFGINTNGATAGGYVDARGTLHGFLRCDRTITTIDVPDATSTGLSGINDRGDIVGGYFDDARRHGFMFSNGRFTTTTAAGAILETFPFDIDDRGRIVGFYF